MPWPQTRRIIGTRVQRIDGPDKATGRAKYSFDINRPGMLHARMLRSPHARARIKSIDTSQAEKTPGYRAFHIIAKPGAELFFAGAEILAICADTEEHAEDCLRAVRVDYDVLPHLVKEQETLEAKQPTVGGAMSNTTVSGDFATANFAQAFDGVAATHEGTYGISIISHQCLESHGLVAEWNQDQSELTVYASTQAVPNTAGALAQYFKIPATRVKCITHYMGGGFGSKFGPDIQGTTAAELARKTRAPVKLMLDRAEEVTVGGQRPSAFGTVKLAGDAQGRVTAFEVDCYGSPGVGGGATVNFGLLPYVYTTVPNVKRRHRVTRMNVQTARAMRAPGHPQNCILTDQPLDDLAARLNVNPMDMRLRNLPANDQAALQNAPTSFLALRNTIYARQIETIRKMSNWDQRWHAPGKGPGTVVKSGLGVAMHTWGGGGRGPNPTKVNINADGSVLVQSGSQDLGTAQRTVTAIIVAEVLGLGVRDITVQLGDSTHGQSTPSGGSTTCPGTSPAILKAAENARDAFLAAIAQRLNAQAADLRLENGHVVNRANNERTPWRQACSRLGMNPIQATGDWPTGPQLQHNAELRPHQPGRRRHPGRRGPGRYRDRRRPLHQGLGRAGLRPHHQQARLRVAGGRRRHHGGQLRPLRRVHLRPRHRPPGQPRHGVLQARRHPGHAADFRAHDGHAGARRHRHRRAADDLDRCGRRQRHLQRHRRPRAQRPVHPGTRTGRPRQPEMKSRL
jgi:xanthine dehydrogenase YagR molybdenum-binding subunit